MKYKVWDKTYRIYRDDILLKPDGSVFIHLFQPKPNNGGLTVLLNANNEDFDIEVIKENESSITSAKIY